MLDNIVTVAQNTITDYLPNQFTYIAFASFEERSLIAARSLKHDCVIKSVIFKSTNVDNEESVKQLSEMLPNNDIYSLDLHKPVEVANRLTTCIHSLGQLDKKPLVIDITTFTHEVLAMLIKLVVDNRQFFSSVHFLYNSASGYSNSKNDGLTQMWLSKGCRDVRNIIGYPGKLRPASKTCVVVLTGFELERATGMIDILEPDRLAIGIGVEPVHDNNKAAMEHFRSEFGAWRENYKNSNCAEFRFSCKDIKSAMNSIEALVKEKPDDNYIIVPLNTKLSTIAASAVALKNSKVQLCYAIPEIYNTKTYSSPSENITILDLFQMDILA